MLQDKISEEKSAAEWINNSSTYSSITQIFPLLSCVGEVYVSVHDVEQYSADDNI